MARPDNVTDAIFVGSDGCSEGHYNDYVLKSAYQPIYGLDNSGRWILQGFEGLIRPYLNGELLEVDGFFKQVQEEDLLFIECICIALHVRNYKHATPSEKLLFINVDVSKFQTVETLETELFYTFSQLPKHGLNRSRVVFEILETEVLEKDVLIRICEMFRNNGFRFALDDFGTKHSNIERFLLIKPDIVKLDRAIFNNFCKVTETKSLLSALIAAFRGSGSEVLLEGLETTEEVSHAAEMSIDMMQGFALGHPELLPAVFDEKIEVQKTDRKPVLTLVETQGKLATS